MALLYTWSLTAARRSRQTKAPSTWRISRLIASAQSLTWRNIPISLIDTKMANERRTLVPSPDQDSRAAGLFRKFQKHAFSTAFMCLLVTDSAKRMRKNVRELLILRWRLYRTKVKKGTMPKPHILQHWRSSLVASAP
jgi:hypothetical protein